MSIYHLWFFNQLKLKRDVISSFQAINRSKIEIKIFTLEVFLKYRKIDENCLNTHLCRFHRLITGHRTYHQYTIHCVPVHVSCAHTFRINEAAQIPIE